MECRMCHSNSVRIVWNEPIRNGGIGSFTDEVVPIYKCCSCGVAWHEPYIGNLDDYYSSNTYRDSVDGNHTTESFYKNHDHEVLNRLEYTGTEMFRNKSVADVGCAAGTFLDYLNGVASEIVAIEPSEYYRSILNRKGYKVYKYANECVADRKESLDVVASFSVIEHVEDPCQFLKDIYDMLKDGGKAIIGTPSDAPLMVDMLGDGIYEKEVLYSVQHLYIFSADSLERACSRIGFRKVHVETFQRYGLSNLLGWLRNKKPKTNVGIEFCEGTMNELFKTRVKELGLGDYLVLYLEK